MPERTISVRLDDGADCALRLLMQRTRTQSEVVCAALIGAVHERAAEDAARVARDPADRREIAEIQRLMDSLAPDWPA